MQIHVARDDDICFIYDQIEEGRSRYCSQARDQAEGKEFNNTSVYGVDDDFISRIIGIGQQQYPQQLQPQGLSTTTRTRNRG